MGHTEWVRSVVFSNSSTRLLTASDDRTARVWDVASGDEVLCLQEHTNRVFLAVFSLDDNLIATASNDHTVHLWDSQTGDQLRIFEGHTSYVRSACFSADNARLATASSDFTIRLRDLRHLHRGGVRLIRNSRALRELPRVAANTAASPTATGSCRDDLELDGLRSKMGAGMQRGPRRSK